MFPSFNVDPSQIARLGRFKTVWLGFGTVS